jgi:8-oxo-dGTP pyrophosphatase MutT (NUDIX family)
MTTERDTTVVDLGRIREALKGYTPRLTAAIGKTPAAVAAILHEAGGTTLLLFIERSEHTEDPWSGDLAFPGGRIEAVDAEPKAAAERETLEETGIDLGAAEYLGRLDDLTGSTLPVVVSAFVYAVSAPGPPVCSAEVRECFWVSLDRLLDPERQLERRFPFRGLEERLLPAIDLLGPSRPVLWGITYRLAARLLELAGQPLPCRPQDRQAL